MPKKQASKTLTLKIETTRESVSERIYANHVEIDHSPYDFTIRFCDINAPTLKEKEELAKSKVIKAPIQAEIVIPVSLVEPFIQALSTNYNTFIKTHVKKGKPQK